MKRMKRAERSLSPSKVSPMGFEPPHPLWVPTVELLTVTFSGEELTRVASETSGEGGIRTHGGDKPHNGFRDRPIQPLWHLSYFYVMIYPPKNRTTAK